MENGDQIDALYYHVLQNSKYDKLWSVFRKLLLLFHGQAAVERSFLVNKEVSTDNLFAVISLHNCVLALLDIFMTQQLYHLPYVRS